MRDGRDGRDGKRGHRGYPGTPGGIGPIAKHEWDGTKIRFQKTDSKWGDWIDLRGIKGDNGLDGQTAYQLAISIGFKGTEEEWLKSLIGKDGKHGKNGRDGKDGKNSLTAYNHAVKNGFKGTEEQWIKSLKGDKGEKGEPGLSAYEVWLSLGHQGTEDDFFNWLADKVREKLDLNLLKNNRGAGPLRILLSKLFDVDDSNKQNGYILKYNSTTKKHEYVAESGGGGGQSFTTVPKNANFNVTHADNFSRYLITGAITATFDLDIEPDDEFIFIVRSDALFTIQLAIGQKIAISSLSISGAGGTIYASKKYSLIHLYVTNNLELQTQSVVGTWGKS